MSFPLRGSVFSEVTLQGGRGDVRSRTLRARGLCSPHVAIVPGPGERGIGSGLGRGPAKPESVPDRREQPSPHTDFPQGREITAPSPRNWLGASLVLRASRYNNDDFKVNILCATRSHEARRSPC